MEQYSQLIFVGLMLAVFWFLLIRPQQQRAKAQREMLAELKPGDTVLTAAGVFGKVVSVGERIRVAVADGSEMEFARFAIVQVVEDEPSGAEPVAGEDPDQDADA